MRFHIQRVSALAPFDLILSKWRRELRGHQRRADRGRAAKNAWHPALEFYATRHTFITQAIRRGENPLAVAQYCGTSLAMIQADYCGTVGLRFDQTVFEPLV